MICKLSYAGNRPKYFILLEGAIMQYVLRCLKRFKRNKTSDNLTLIIRSMGPIHKYKIDFCKGPSIKDVRSRRGEEGVVQCGQGGKRGSSDAEVRTFLEQKTLDFLKFTASTRPRGGPVRIR